MNRNNYVLNIEAMFNGVNSNAPLTPENTSSMYNNDFSDLNDISISDDLGMEICMGVNPNELDDIDEEEEEEEKRVVGATNKWKMK